LLKRHHNFFLPWEEDRKEFFEISQKFIKYCRPIYADHVEYCDCGQLSQIIGCELYFRMHHYNEINTRLIMKRASITGIKQMDFPALYETLDVFLDTVSKIDTVNKSPINNQGRFTLREPQKYCDFVEIFL